MPFLLKGVLLDVYPILSVHFVGAEQSSSFQSAKQFLKNCFQAYTQAERIKLGSLAAKNTF